ncbi:MAG: MotE family protein [Syntrophomonadaceae bacterium]|jgi:flagellar protein FlbB
MKSAGKILLALFLILIIVAGTGYLLIYIDMIETPAVVKKIPLLNNMLPEEETMEAVSNNTTPEPQKAQDLEDKINELETQLKQTEQKLKSAEKKEAAASEQLVNLNEQLLNSQTRQSSQQEAYRDLAKYYAEMKAKDAAQILSRLKDEDIIGILGELEPDQGAEILQNFDTNRAAVITGKMLVVSE